MNPKIQKYRQNFSFLFFLSELKGISGRFGGLSGNILSINILYLAFLISAWKLSAV